MLKSAYNSFSMENEIKSIAQTDLRVQINQQQDIKLLQY